MSWGLWGGVLWGWGGGGGASCSALQFPPAPPPPPPGGGGGARGGAGSPGRARRARAGAGAEAALAWLVPRARVQLSDVNGPRGGVDKRCQVELRTAGTGTVVINSAVRLAPAAVSHGRLVVRIEEDPVLAQALSTIEIDEEIPENLGMHQQGRLAFGRIGVLQRKQLVAQHGE